MFLCNTSSSYGARSIVGPQYMVAPVIVVVIAVIMKVCGKLGSQVHLAGGWCQGAFGVR